MLLKEYTKAYTSYVNSKYNSCEVDTEDISILLDCVLPNKVLSIYERATILERFIQRLAVSQDSNIDDIPKICNKCFICVYITSRGLLNTFYENCIYKDIEKYVLENLSVFIKDLGYNPKKFLRFYHPDVVCDFLETHSIIFFIRDICFFNPFFASKIKLC